MEVRVGEVAQVVDDHGVVCAPGEAVGHIRPGVPALELGHFGQRPERRTRRIAGEEPDETVAALDRVGADAERRHGAPAAVVRDARERAVLAVGPAVIRAGEDAAGHLAERQLELAVGAAVLECAQLAVGAAVHGDGLAPEPCRDHLPWPDCLVVLHGVPVVGVEAGCPDLLAQVARVLERGRRGRHGRAPRAAPSGGGATAGTGRRRYRTRQGPRGPGTNVE